MAYDSKSYENRRKKKEERTPSSSKKVEFSRDDLVALNKAGRPKPTDKEYDDSGRYTGTVASNKLDAEVSRMARQAESEGMKIGADAKPSTSSAGREAKSEPSSSPPSPAPSSRGGYASSSRPAPPSPSGGSHGSQTASTGKTSPKKAEGPQPKRQLPGFHGPGGVVSTVSEGGATDAVRRKKGGDDPGNFRGKMDTLLGAAAMMAPALLTRGRGKGTVEAGKSVLDKGKGLIRRAFQKKRTTGPGAPPGKSYESISSGPSTSMQPGRKITGSAKSGKGAPQDPGMLDPSLRNFRGGGNRTAAEGRPMFKQAPHANRSKTSVLKGKTGAKPPTKSTGSSPAEKPSPKDPWAGGPRPPHRPRKGSEMGRGGETKIEFEGDVRSMRGGGNRTKAGGAKPTKIRARKDGSSDNLPALPEPTVRPRRTVNGKPRPDAKGERSDASSSRARKSENFQQGLEGMDYAKGQVPRPELRGSGKSPLRPERIKAQRPSTSKKITQSKNKRGK